MSAMGTNTFSINMYIDTTAIEITYTLTHTVV